MRRLLLFLGLLIIPTTTFASPVAISPWVRAVIDMAESGIETANSFDATTPCENKKLLDEIEGVISTLRANVDTTVGLAKESQFFREPTFCFDNDKRLLEAALNRIRDALKTATQSCALEQSAVLRTVYIFTTEAYRSFLLGAWDPTIKDDRLKYHYRFESKIRWTTQSEDRVPFTDPAPPALPTPLCPFTTNYGPHSIANTGTASAPVLQSFGCDANVLQSTTDAFGEKALWVTFVDNTQSFSSEIYGVLRSIQHHIDDTIAMISGTTRPPPLTSTTATIPPHAVREGCFTAQGLSDPVGSAPLPQGVLARTTTDPFLGISNPVVLLRAFSDTKAIEGYLRPLSVRVFGGSFDNAFAFFSRGDSANMFRIIASNIERETAFNEALSRDAYERSAEVAAPLENAILALGTATETFLPNQYIPSVAYFLSRSCVGSTCQATLDAVAKRTFNPYCHPYLSGRSADPDTAKKCFCDTSLQTSWSDWEMYCGETFRASDYIGYSPAPIMCGE